MRAIVLGGNGMLGRAVAALWRQRGEAVLAIDLPQADITDREGLCRWIDDFRPRLVVNCAAFTQVDACETERETAFEVNGRAVANVVDAAERAGAELIQISTDYVFDGRAAEPYCEDAATAPLSVYGASKLLGEQEARRYSRALVLRTSWLYGLSGANFVATIAGLLRQGRTPLKVVDDQIGRPTFTPFLALAIWDLATAGVHGLVHYGNREPVSWYGFAREIARYVAPEARSTMLPVTTAEFPRPAPRPAYSVLDVARFEQAVGRPVETWQAGLGAYFDSDTSVHGEISCKP